MVNPTAEKIVFDVSASPSENLKRMPENARWAVKKNYVEGEDQLFLESLVKGTLKIVTDGSHHPEEHVATAAVHVEAEDGSTLTLILQTPGNQVDPQSHRAELSGHFVMVMALELLCDWAKKEDEDIQSVGAVVGCDKKESLQIYDNEYWFGSQQRDCDLLKSLQLRLQSMEMMVTGKRVKGHQDDMWSIDQLDWWGRTNVRCDQLAKAHLSKTTNVLPRQQAHSGWFPEENVRTHVKGTK